MADFREAVRSWNVPDGEYADTPPQQWTLNDDGSITITLPPNIAANFGVELAEWDILAGQQNAMPEGWKRSPKLRENRRESVVYGNCLSMIRSYLGRRETLALMQRAKQMEIDAGRWKK
jgi:hypothetical protein